MKIEKIKSLPKYMEEIIRRYDKKNYPTQDGHTRYYAYLTKNEGELCKVFVAVKCHKGQWYGKQCIWQGVSSDFTFVKDTEYQYVSGYATGFHDKGLYKERKWYEDGKWYKSSFMFNPFAPIVNTEYISKLPRYKYSAYEQYDGWDIFSYLRNYEKYPNAELFVKMGLSDYCYSVQMLKKATKDKAFCKWLYRHSEELGRYRYNIPAIMRAYKKNVSLEEAQHYESLKVNTDLRPILKLFGDDYKKYLDYAKEKKIGHRVYLDYMNACLYLGIDMTENKNRMPHDFRRWHDIRIDEAASKREREDQEKRKEFYETFSEVAEKYSSMQNTDGHGFVMVIAKSPKELQIEGRELRHCVGKFGYDNKFVREESLIFFLRKPDELYKPYVTVEYSLKQKRILQCYGKCNSKPEEEAREFIDAVWLPEAEKALKKIIKERVV